MGHYPLGPVAIKSACLFSVVNPGPKLPALTIQSQSKPSLQGVEKRG